MPCLFEEPSYKKFCRLSLWDWTYLLLTHTPLHSAHLILILQASLGCKAGTNHNGTLGISLSLMESSTGWWVSWLRKIVPSILCGDLSHFQCDFVGDVGGGFFCLPIAWVALVRSPAMTLSFLCLQPLSYSEAQGWRRSCREGLHAGVWAALVRSGENHQKAIGSLFCCVFRNNCVSLDLLVLWLCSALVLWTLEISRMRLRKN